MLKIHKKEINYCIVRKKKQTFNFHASEEEESMLSGLMNGGFSGSFYFPVFFSFSSFVGNLTKTRLYPSFFTLSLFLVPRVVSTSADFLLHFVFS